MQDSITNSTASSNPSFSSLPSPSDSPLFKTHAKLGEEILKKNKLKFEGHRGAGLLEPENTLRAFQKAIDLGINGVELDVWLSADNVPIVVHGTDEGIIEFKNSLLNVHANKVHSKNLKEWQLPNDEYIPTLEEVLLLCKDKAKVNIELKDESPLVGKLTLELVKKLDMFNQICYSSFIHKHKSHLEEARKELRIDHQVEFGFLVWQTTDFVEYKTLFTEGDTLNIDIELLLKHEEFIVKEMAWAKERKMGLKYYFGFELEENNEIYQRLEDMEVDTLIINHPLKVNEFIKHAPLAA